MISNVCAFALFLSSLAFGQVYPGSFATEASVKVAETSNLRAAGYAPNDPFFDMQYDTYSKIGVVEYWRRWGLTASNPAVDVPVILLTAGLDCNHPELKGRVDMTRSHTFVFEDFCDDPGGADTAAAVAVFGNMNNGIGVAGFNQASSLIVLKVCENQTIAPGVVVAVCPQGVVSQALDYIKNLQGRLFVVQVSLPLLTPAPALVDQFRQLEGTGRFTFVGAALDQPKDMSSITAIPCTGAKTSKASICVGSIADRGFLASGSWGEDIIYTSYGNFIQTGFVGGKRWGFVNGAYNAAMHTSGTVALHAATAEANGLLLNAFQLKELMMHSLRFEPALITNVPQRTIGVPGALCVFCGRENLEVILQGGQLPIYPVVTVNQPGNAGDPFTTLSFADQQLTVTGTGFAEGLRFGVNGVKLESIVTSATTAVVLYSDEAWSLGYGMLYGIWTGDDGRPVAMTYVPVGVVLFAP